MYKLNYFAIILENLITHTLYEHISRFENKLFIEHVKDV